MAAPVPPRVEALPAVPAEDRYAGPTSEQLNQMPVRQRIEMLQQFHPEAAEELALDTVFQFMMARTSVDVIALRMGYSVGWVMKKRDALRKRYQAEAEKLDVRNYTLGMLEQLKEIAAMGMREAAIAKPSEYGRRMSGVNTARNALQDQAKLLHLAGAYETAPLRAAIQNDDEHDPAAGLKELSRNFLTMVYDAKGIKPGDTIIDQPAEDE